MAKSSPRAIIDEETSDQLDKDLGFDKQVPDSEKSPYHGLDANTLSTLRTVEDNLVKEIAEATKSAVRHKMKIGALMIEAKDLFTDDQQFGRWRQDFAKQHLPATSPSALNDYQRLSLEYKNAPDFVEKVGQSVAVELINAAPAVHKRVLGILEEGETPTVKDVREAKRDSKSGKNPPPNVPGHSIPKNDRKPGNVVTLDERLQLCREEDDWAERWKMLQDIDCMDIQRAFTLFGLLMPNDGESYSMGTLDILFNDMIDLCEDSQTKRVMGQAAELIKKGDY